MPRKLRLVGGGERPNGSRGTNIDEVSLARILLATACPGSPALGAGSFTLSKGPYEFLITLTRIIMVEDAASDARVIYL